MLDFIVNNAVWFILAIVLIALVVIGYYVDKKGFNSNKLEEDLKDNGEEDLNEIKRKVKKEVIDMNIPFVPVEEKKEEKQEPKQETPLTETMKASGIATLGDYLNKQSETTQSPATPNLNMGGEDLNVPFGDQPVQPNINPTINEDLNVPFGDQPVGPQPQPVGPQPQPANPQPQAPKEEDIWNV